MRSKLIYVFVYKKLITVNSYATLYKLNFLKKRRKSYKDLVSQSRKQNFI